MTMKALLTGIQTSLKNAATLSAVDDANIFITPDEDIIPMAATLPSIGLKDGTINMTRSSSAPGGKYLWDITYQAHVVIYVDMAAGETPVIGQTNPALKGTLDLNDLIRTVLHDNALSIAGVQDAYCVAEGASEIIGSDDMIILKKRMTFEYQSQEAL